MPTSHLKETWHHPYSEAWWQHHATGDVFQQQGLGRLVGIEGKMNRAKYRENLLQSAQDLRLG
jgi:hypothetical protein